MHLLITQLQILSGILLFLYKTETIATMSAKFSYDKAILEIETIIEEIENGSLNVDELSEKVKYVAQLIKSCKKKLTDTKAEVDLLLKTMDAD
jgi:exodeoxyribonuclease VII small subunit